MWRNRNIKLILKNIQLRPKMEFIPKIVQYEIMLGLPLKDLVEFCRVSKKFSIIGRDQFFWRSKVKRDFPKRRDPVDINIDWQKLYRLYFDYERILGRFNFNVDIEWPEKTGEYYVSDFENYQRKSVISRLCTVSGKTPANIIDWNEVKLSAKFTYLGNTYSLVIYLKRTMYIKPDQNLNMDTSLDICIDNLKFLIYLAEPTFYKEWSALDEVSQCVIPKFEKFQPYWYFHLPSNYISKRNYSKHLHANFKDFYYDILFKNKPSFLIESNINYTKFQRCKIGHLNTIACIGYHVGIPFIIYENGEKCYIKVACENPKLAIDEIVKIIIC